MIALPRSIRNAALMSAAAALLLAACGAAPTAAPPAAATAVPPKPTAVPVAAGPKKGGTLIAARSEDMKGLDPHKQTAFASFRMLELVYDPLLTFDKDMKLTLDSTKFSDALKNHKSDVTALLDTGMGDLNTLVSRFAGSSGSLANTLTSIEDQRKSYDKRIAKYNENLTVRKQTLYNQYLGFQTQIADYGRTAQWLGMFTGTTTDSSG